MDLPMIGGPFDGGEWEVNGSKAVALWDSVKGGWAVYELRDDEYVFVEWGE